MSLQSTRHEEPLPYRYAWKRAGLDFFEQYPQEDGSIFLFNTYTGEAIYDVDRWGSPLLGMRKFSHWFDPVALVPATTTSRRSSGRSSESTKRDSIDDFSGREYRARWYSAELIQRNVRAALGRWRVARALLGTWTKEYDVHAERYSFTHNTSEEKQYHKPWGMGTADLWGSPRDKVDEALLSLFLRVEDATVEEDVGEDPRDWEDSKRQRHRLYRFYREKNLSEGPYCRICGPGSLKESSFTNVFLYPKKYYRVKPFSHPRDRQFEGARLGTSVTCMDKLVEKRIMADPYFHVRNVSEHGALSVIKLMFKHRDDLRVQGVGLQRMAGSLLEEDAAGGATEGLKKYVEKALELLRSHPNVEWIQAEACAALASMTSGLCVRKELEREHSDWLEDVVTAIMGTKSVTKVVKEIDHAGKETRYDIKIPSPMAHLVALHGCRILANMACDETTHEVVVEAGTQEALQGMLNELEPDDRKEKEMLTRALAALEPDGWRGVDHGLRDEDIPAPQGDSSASVDGSTINSSDGPSTV